MQDCASSHNSDAEDPPPPPPILPPPFNPPLIAAHLKVNILPPSLSPSCSSNTFLRGHDLWFCGLNLANYAISPQKNFNEGKNSSFNWGAVGKK